MWHHSCVDVSTTSSNDDSAVTCYCRAWPMWIQEILSQSLLVPPVRRIVRGRKIIQGGNVGAFDLCNSRLLMLTCFDRSLSTSSAESNSIFLIHTFFASAEVANQPIKSTLQYCTSDCESVDVQTKSHHLELTESSNGGLHAWCLPSKRFPYYPDNLHCHIQLMCP